MSRYYFSQMRLSQDEVAESLGVLPDTNAVGKTGRVCMERMAERTETSEMLGEKLDYQTYDLHVKEILENEALSGVEKSEKILQLTSLIGDDAPDGLVNNIRHEVLPELLEEGTYREAGRALAQALERSDIPRELVAEMVPVLAGYPQVVAEEIIQRFVDKKLIKRKKDGTIKSQNTEKATRNLMRGELDMARKMRRLYADVPEVVESLDDVKRLHEEHDEDRAIHEVHIHTNRDGARLLPINELRIGHQDAATGIQLSREVAAVLKGADRQDQPDAILVSNLIQGDFTHSQALKRASLVSGLNSMDNQFATARLLLDELRETGIPIIHTLGADDHRIARDYTLDVINEIKKISRESGDGHINYYNRNQLMQAETFQQHMKFQLQYALPLCYRMGRRLRSADEMDTLSGDEPSQSEYLALYNYVVFDEPLPSSIDIDESIIRSLGEWHNNTVVVDDANIHFHTNGKDRLYKYRHVNAFSPDTLSGNHMDIAMKRLGNLATNGYELPDAEFSGRAQEAIYVTAAGVPVVSLPGMTDPKLSFDSAQYYRNIAGDASRRATATRKRFWKPTIDDFEIADNGDVIHRYINKDFLDKADSLPRTAVFELCDIQKGSPTSRSDYLVKYLSLILEYAERMPVAIQWAGDIIHGHIYPGFSDESQSVGLIKIQSQKLAIEDTLMKSWGHPDIPRVLLDSFIDILVQQGNHDEIQRKQVPNNNDSNIDYLIHTQRSIFDTRKNPEDPSIVRHNAIFHTASGTPVPTWMGTTHLGAYTIRTAHYHLDRGVKGNTGGLPVLHAYNRAVGIGHEEDADIYLGAHWHNEQSAMIDNKLVVVGGAWAERSQFEDIRGYDAKMAGSVIFIGGGEPPEVRFIHAERLDMSPIKYGYFTPDNLEAHGFRDDPGFDPERHAQYSSDVMPKSAVQKALNHIERQASQLSAYEAQMENQNTYDASGNPTTLNPVTSRAFEVAARKKRVIN